MLCVALSSPLLTWPDDSPVFLVLGLMTSSLVRSHPPISNIAGESPVVACGAFLWANRNLARCRFTASKSPLADLMACLNV